MTSVLSAEDAERYRLAFAADRAGRPADADRLIRQTGDKLLVGTLLAQRYTADGYRPSHADLVEWLKQYRDLPQARQIHDLASRSKPRKGAAPPAPTGAETTDFGGERLVAGAGRLPVPAKPRSNAQNLAVQKYGAQMTKFIRAGESKSAEAILGRAELRDLLSIAEYDDWRRRIAWGYFLENEDEAALRLAAPAAERNRANVPQADWVAGLAAYRLGRLDNAQRHFEELAANRAALSWDNTAGAYWAARAAIKLRQPKEAMRLWAMAAESPRTFYGILAQRQLGRALPYDWAPPPLDRARAERLLRIGGVRRAVALAQIDEQALAERELAALHQVNRGDEMVGALMGLAARIDTPAAQYRMAQLWRDNRNKVYDSALYPLPPWEPDGGFQIDRTLVFAFMRQESGFNARALSPAGAAGLMQLMPRTATLISTRDERKERLFAPQYNIELGQRYLIHLRDLSLVKGNLIYMAAAYNAGPGNLQRWAAAIDARNDPLIFIESIPSAETRNFVMRVLANHWIYRYRLDDPPASLDALAGNRWPYYDGGRGQGRVAAVR